jgi:Uncharacterised protein family (UPF0158)
MENKTNAENKRRYQIDLGLLGDVMLSARNPGRQHFFLDTDFGQPEILSDDLLNTVLEKGNPEIGNLSEEECKRAFLARRIFEDEEGRYVDLPAIDAITEYSWMADFAEFVGNPELYSELKELFDVSEKVNRFYELLKEHPEEFELWCHQMHSRKCVEAKELLAECGIVEGERFCFRWK